MKTRAAVLGLVTVGTLLVGATDSRGDGKLNAAQEAARAQFQEDMKPALARLKDQCGVDMTVTTDFENYDRNAWLDGLYAEEWEAKSYSAIGKERVRAELTEKKKTEKPQLATACSQLVYGVAATCTSQNTGGSGEKPRRGESAPPPTAPTNPYDVKSIACLFAGHQKPTDHEPTDDHVVRNLSFTNGQLTLRNGPLLMNVGSNVHTVLNPKVPADHRRNGLQCSSRSQCKSFACVKGTCEPCGPTVACAASAYCSGGICYTKEQAPSEDESPVSSGGGSKPGSKPKAKGSERGRMCGKGSDCQSGSCKMENRTRGRCQ